MNNTVIVKVMGGLVVAMFGVIITLMMARTDDRYRASDAARDMGTLTRKIENIDREINTIRASDAQQQAHIISVREALRELKVDLRELSKYVGNPDVGVK